MASCYVRGAFYGVSLKTFITECSMTRKYLYIITTGSLLCAGDLFLMVSVSTRTTQGIRDANFLTHYAAKMGHFFAIWSPVIDEFITKCEKSLMFPFRSQITKCYARDLVRHFKNGNPLPWCAAHSENLSSFLSAASPSFLFQSRLHAHLSPAKWSPRNT